MLLRLLYGFVRIPPARWYEGGWLLPLERVPGGNFPAPLPCIPVDAEERRPIGRPFLFHRPANRDNRAPPAPYAGIFRTGVPATPPRTVGWHGEDSPGWQRTGHRPTRIAKHRPWGKAEVLRLKFPLRRRAFRRAVADWPWQRFCFASGHR